ncbi:AtpZ/AtpI family protein [Zhongshania sp. BJYM1]|uniref:AtpZ/AtpI family protein n=1 Tax=Zhongshania aquatica TaxID=2965069 RepID=UPI0022B3F972|nr:AtpZ/AtpI family protein [Marortus sp. BJYM1]
MTPKEPRDARTPFSDTVGSKAARKLRAQQVDTPGIWFGLGMMGLVGWSVAVPTLLGATLGVWLDKHYPGDHTYTLALLMVGLCLGCFNAWHWVGKEQRDMHDQANQTTQNRGKRPDE